MSQPRELEALTLAVERRFGRGPVEDWSQRDFELLSKDVEQLTRQLLSVTTLKRVLGRITFEGRPLLHTLNTLAMYTGTESWGRFTEQLYQSLTEPQAIDQSELQAAPIGQAESYSSSVRQHMPVATPSTYDESSVSPVGASQKGFSSSDSSSGRVSTSLTGQRRLRQMYWLAGTSLVVALGIFIVWPASKASLVPSSRTLFAPPGILTTVLPENQGLPYTVEFIYHGPRLPKESLNLIMFEKGQMQYVKIDSNGRGHVAHKFTEPGMYWPKVVSNKEVIAQTSLMVPSQGWYCKLRQKRLTKVIDRASYRERQTADIGTPALEGPIGLTGALAAKAGIDTSEMFYTVWSQTRDFHASADAFSFYADIFCQPGAISSREGAVILKFMGKLGTFHVQMAAKRSLESLYEQISEVTLDSATSYEKLARLRINTLGNHKYKVQVGSGNFMVSVDGNPVLSQAYTQPVGELYGVEISTTGPSTVRDLSVRRQDIVPVNN